MTLELLPQAVMPRRRTAVQKRKIEDALNCFPREYRAAVCKEAAENFALADLALSFPALLFVIAVPHAGIDGGALRKRVIEGHSLKQLARLAGLPLWLRHMSPFAFAHKIHALPSGELVARQMKNFVPRKTRHHARWLWNVSYACRWGHEGFALWMAKMWPTTSGTRPEETFSMLALWAWYSQQPETEFGRLVQKRWRLDMDWKQAVKACNSWIESVRLQLDVHIAPRLPKFSPRTVEGFDFIHLATGEMLADEAITMRNCIKSYGYDIACLDNELWSMRKNGARVATLCIGSSGVDGLPAIIEIKLTDNKCVTRDVAMAARSWFSSHDISAISIVRRDLPDDAVRNVWQRGFKPYWLAKRAFPWWLRMGGKFRLRFA